MDIGLEGAVAIATLNWQRTEDDPCTWTARDNGLLYIMTSHREGGRAIIDVSVFHPRAGLLREWRWMLGSTFDRLPDAPVEGTA